MSTTVEISKKLGAARKIAEIWGGLLINAKDTLFAGGAIGDGVTDDTVAIQSAINESISSGNKVIFFPKGTYKINPDTLTGYDDVIFVGNGASFVGDNNLQIIQMDDVGISRTALMYARALNETHLPAGSLAKAIQAIARGVINIVFIGDSITSGYDINSPYDAYAKRLEKQIRDALPGVTVNLVNYAIGGKVFGNFTDPSWVPPAEVPWATVPGKAWRDYAKDYAPDLIIVAYGMNESYGNGADKTHTENWQAFKSFIATWNKVPSVVAVALMLPTRNANRFSQSVMSTQAVARSCREFARNNGYALADANRLYVILRDGKDDVTQASTSEWNWYGYDTDMWSGDKSSFSLSGNTLSPVSGAGNYHFIARNRKFYNGNIAVTITPTVAGYGGSEGWINYRKDAALGQLTVLVVAGPLGTGSIGIYSGATSIANVGADIPLNVASQILIEVDGSHHKVYLNGTLMIDHVTYERMHDGDVEIGSASILPTFSDFRIDFTDAVQSTPLYTEDDLIGPYNKPELSGNGINHPTGFGHAVFYLSAFNKVVDHLRKVEVRPWRAPTLLNSWMNYGDGFNDVGFRVDGDWLELRGLIKGGTVTQFTTLFYLDADCLPLKKSIHSTFHSSGGCTIWSMTDGAILIGDTLSVNTWLSLEGIRIYIGQ